MLSIYLYCVVLFLVFFFKQKTAYEMRISDWSSDVCSSDLTNHRFCVYLSNTNTIAKNACKDIIGYLKSPNSIAVFGEIKMIKESETDSLWIFELTTPEGRVKKCILRAVGAGQQMRGINIDNQRPDMAVVDDVEDNENTESELLQKKLDRWIFGPFLKALARRKKVIWLGNMLQKTRMREIGREHV